MKKNIMIIGIQLLLAVVMFVISFTIFNYMDLKKKGEAVAELSNPSYPVMEIGTDGINYDLMMGYRSDINLALVRNQIALTDTTGTIQLRLHHYDYDITAIHYTLFRRDPEDPLEKGTLNKLEVDTSNNVRTADLSFKTEIKDNEYYYLKLGIRLDSNTQVYYYTKLMNGSGSHFPEYLEFAKNFHDNLFDEGTIDSNAIYLEPSENVRESTIENVDIHSSLSAVYFGRAKMQQQEEPRVSIRELNDTYIVLQMNTIVSSEEIKQEYDLTEYYKMRYTPSRMYLLDYERTMDAYYNEELIDSGKSMISLGVQDRNAVSFISADEGKKACFSEQGQLWYYDYQKSNVTNVYSFVPELKTDLHNDNHCHGIKTLTMDDRGNIVYIAYGYINRGHREGQNGLLIMRYDARRNTSEEMTFLETPMSYEEMKEDVKKFTYLNKENKFYCCLGGTLYEIDLKEKTFNVMREGLEDDMLTASESQSIIAIQPEKDLMKSRELELINLETGTRKTFSCDTSKLLCAVGFLTEDFIYGEAEEENLGIRNDGTILFPISVLRFVNKDGKEVKTYKKSNRYFVDAHIEGNVLQMTIGKKKKNGSAIRSTGQKDYIRYKDKDVKDQAFLTYEYSGTYWNQLYLGFPDYIYIQVKPDLQVARITTREDSPLMILKELGGNTMRYYVYASGEETGSCHSLAKAISIASEKRGHVVDSNETILWECAFASYRKVAGMNNVEKVSSDRKSLAGCLSMIAAVNGKSIPPRKIDTNAGNPASLLEKYSGHKTLNLTGCTTDEILYYVSKGSPVLAKYSEKRFVVVMSYNSTNIRYLDPVTGLSTSVFRDELRKKFAKAGNVFYSYLE